MSLPIKIGNYRFERNLGNGTFGKVKRKSLYPLATDCHRLHIGDFLIHFCSLLLTAKIGDNLSGVEGSPMQ